MRYAVAPQLIGYQPPGFVSLAFQQPMKEAFGCILIATGLDKNIDYIPVLVNRAPEIMLLTPDSHEEFVQMLSITQAALSSLEWSRRTRRRTSDTTVGWSRMRL